MNVESTAKYMRISPDKVRPLMRRVCGLPVNDALSMMQFSPKKGAAMVRKVMKAAVANAVNNHESDAEQLRVARATVTAGPSLRRFWPRARGSASPIRKRTSHITVELTDGRDEAQASVADAVRPPAAG